MSHKLLFIIRKMSKKNKSNQTNKVINGPRTNTSIVPTNDDMPIQLDKAGNVCIRILAKPGAKQNAVTEITSEGVGVQIAAPPMEGEANSALIKYLSKVLNLRKSDLQLDKGMKSRNKVILISKGATTPEIVLELIEKEINK